ncbi:MAG: hypothetical protein ACI8V5_004428, partial [Limisphaerales bacterium]
KAREHSRELQRSDRFGLKIPGEIRPSRRRNLERSA